MVDQVAEMTLGAKRWKFWVKTRLFLSLTFTEETTLDVALCCGAKFIYHHFKDIHVLLLAAPSNPGQIVIHFSAAGAECSNCVMSIFFSAAHFVCKLRLNTWRGKKKSAGKKKITLICFRCRVHTSEQTVQICGRGNLWGEDFPTCLIKVLWFSPRYSFSWCVCTLRFGLPGQKGLRSPKSEQGEESCSITHSGLKSQLI